MVTANGAEVVGLKLLSPAFVAVIAHEPVPEMTCSFPLTIEQAVELPAPNVVAPVPDPPEVVIIASASPKAALLGPVIESVA